MDIQQAVPIMGPAGGKLTQEGSGPLVKAQGDFNELPDLPDFPE
jgi:hypothetical protein